MKKVLSDGSSQDYWEFEEHEQEFAEFFTLALLKAKECSDFSPFFLEALLAFSQKNDDALSLDALDKTFNLIIKIKWNAIKEATKAWESLKELEGGKDLPEYITFDYRKQAFYASEPDSEAENGVNLSITPTSFQVGAWGDNP